MEFLKERLRQLESRSLRRFLRNVEGAQEAEVFLNGRKVLLLCGNNYLGLASDPRVIEAVTRALASYGLGSGASRLISGSMSLHRRLEEKLASFKGTEAALLFSTGYMANLGILGALAEPQDVIFSDALNHASIIDGCRLSRAAVRVYPHKDVDSLEKMLQEGTGFQRRFLITDTLFSMDGDLAPLPGLAALAARYDAHLIVDEAHATGTLGPGGCGAVEHFGLRGQVPVIMGTLSKALGAFGAFVAGDRVLVDYLVNVCRPFIFTTAPPPALAAGVLAALEVLQTDPARVERLQENQRFFRDGLQRLGFDTGASESHIIPVMIGEEKRTMAFCERLLQDHGVYVQGIRPPTVPPGTSRLRITLMSTHRRDQLEHALEATGRVGKSLGVIG
ncbi:MAG: 8-amino-7-oxononanoate synthase [Acidobacteria bacterium]|nr:8-amino-7-oxononanoate synthase [Acidobacteriota bacterium]